jgi:serine protease Do
MKRKQRFVGIVITALVIGMISGGFGYSIAQDQSILPLAARSQIAQARDLSEAFKYVSKAVQPSVVSIRSVKRIQVASAAPQQQMQIPEELQRFFGSDESFHRFAPIPRQRPQREQNGLGTGVVVSADGYILTNNHVVAGADKVSVTLQDDRQFDAEVVGTDPKSDLAVLRIDASGLTPAMLGDSDDLEVGDWVLAIGSPFGLRQTVTAGIVSATGRVNMGITDYEDFVQTDAAINPGNSGGPLVNMRGEVIGINTAIASRSGVYNGIGFAIPSNMARSVKDAIITNGRVDRGQLGALIQNLTRELAQSFGFTGTKGVLIGDVVPGSAAAQAGLKSGDIVLSFDGRDMTDLHQLRNAVAATTPGENVELVIFRDGKQITVSVEIGRLTGTAVGASGSTTSKLLGASLQSLDDDAAKELGYDSSQRGVIVTGVERGRLASQAGLRVRDFVVSLIGNDISSVSDFNKIMDEVDLSDGIRMQVLNESGRRFVFLRSK